MDSRHFPTICYYSLTLSSTLDNEGNEVSYLCHVIPEHITIIYQLSIII